METIDSLQWLKKNQLYDMALNFSNVLRKVFVPCLKPKDEKILVVGDKGFKSNRISPILSGAYYLAAESLNLNTKLILQEVKGGTSPADAGVVNSLNDLKESNIIVINMSDKLGSIKEIGRSFRKFCKEKKHRFISATSLGDVSTDNIDHMISAIDINYKPMQLQHQKIKEQFDNAKEIKVVTKAGTELYYNIEGIKSSLADGDYAIPGVGGNMPAGEVYTPPKEKKVEGKVVIDGSSRNHKHTVIIKEPIRLAIEKGSVIEINGGEEAKQLERTLDWAASRAKHPKTVRRIGEFGIGLNPKAKIIGATIIDEKTIGTAHIAIGSNYWFGGNVYTIIHLDQIFKNPQIYVDNNLLEY